MDNLWNVGDNLRARGQRLAELWREKRMHARLRGIVKGEYRREQRSVDPDSRALHHLSRLLKNWRRKDYRRDC